LNQFSIKPLGHKTVSCLSITFPKNIVFRPYRGLKFIGGDSIKFKNGKNPNFGFPLGPALAFLPTSSKENDCFFGPSRRVKMDPRLPRHGNQV